MNNPLSCENIFLEECLKKSFAYFVRNANSDNGLVADTNRSASPCSIGVTGFALTAYCIGVERGWMSRQEALKRILSCLQFFWNSAQGDHANVTGYKGFFYHFLDMKTGLRVWDCELSMIDTALLMAGILAVSAFCDGTSAPESDIRDLSDKLYRRVDWEWARNGGHTLAQGWKPECGFLHYGWEGYNEGTILYLLALASPDHPLNEECYRNWAITYQWENIYGQDVLYAGPLFIHQFSHAWVDFRNIRDAFMREKKSDYFENSKRSVYVHQTYSLLNPQHFVGYGDFAWGLSAGEGPADISVSVGGRQRPCFGYCARGVPFGPDDGTIAPSAIAASIPFAPEVAVPTLVKLVTAYPALLTDVGLATGINFSATGEKGQPWVSPGAFGLDQGIITLMLENFRSNFVWDLMKKSPYLVCGLRRAGFEGGWLS